jgi:hypothetical protein
VPGLVLHFQQLRQGELAKQYSHVAAAAGSTAGARSPVRGRGGAGTADGAAAAADPSQLLNEVRESSGAPLGSRGCTALCALAICVAWNQLHKPATSYRTVSGCFSSGTEYWT